MPAWALSVLTTLVALAVVLGLAWLVLRLLGGLPGGRLGGRPGGGGPGASGGDALRFVRALPVGAKERVVLIEHGGERWMLGVTAGGISVLARWPQSADAAETAHAAAPDRPAMPARMMAPGPAAPGAGNSPS